MISISTQHPIAEYSPDHLYPFGTARDNSVNPAFNRKLYEVIPAVQVRLLDLGCAGGGLVKSIIGDGGFAIGIDGSNYSKTMARAEWATIPEYLFTADIVEPFEIRAGSVDGIQGFNVITAWEFFEHIAEIDIPGVITNIKRHLDPGGFVIGSICPLPHPPYHRTLRPKPWWVQRFFELGLSWYPQMELRFDGCMVRTEGFPIALRAQ
jgi:2-polyprenyl-3-methyl-5-hydroxy-6-metoxy-1,4-benzoquinol methylase